MSDTAAGYKSSSGQRWQRLVVIAAYSLAAWAALLLIIIGARNANETQNELRLIPWLSYDQRVDFGYFYAAADMVWHGDASELYPKPGEYILYPYDPLFSVVDDEYVKARMLARGNYYNPPIVAFLQAPLTELGFRTAFWAFSAVGIAMLLVFLFLAWRAGRHVPEMPLVILGVLAFRPVHEAVIMGHLSLVFCFALGAGFLALKADKPVLAGLTLSLLATKPQWAVLPGLLLLVRGEWRALFTMGFASAVIVLMPFIATGLESFKDYVEFLRSSAVADVKIAPHMFSWNGFLSKRIAADPFLGPVPEPNLILLYSLQAITVVLMLLVWRGRDLYLSVAATIMAMLLVSTRSVWYDWAFVSVVAVFLALRPSTPNVRMQGWAFMIAIFIASAQSTGALFEPDGRHGSVHWVTPAFFSVTLVAFAGLVWMAAVSTLERGLRLPIPRRRAAAGDGSRGEGVGGERAVAPGDAK